MSLRIAVLNDYPMGEALALVARGDYPAHHTWGASRFEALGARVVLMPFLGVGLWKSLLTQLITFLTQWRFDVVYAACQSETWLLARLRCWGLFRRPIVAVIHHPIKGRLRGGSSYFKGHDCLLFLSQLARDEALHDMPGVADRCETIAWGVDLDFYDRAQNVKHDFGQGYFVSAGKANRDHQTLADSAMQGQHRTVIICSSNTAPQRYDRHWVTVASDANGQAMSYAELTGVYRTARAIVIPLQEVKGLAGLTSLLDAMGCSLPVIMTRNRSVDVDVEALGFGIWVPPGDVPAMLSAMNRIGSGDTMAREMGRKARAFAERHYNYNAFAKLVFDRCVAVAQVARA